jgi:glycosidase
MFDIKRVVVVMFTMVALVTPQRAHCSELRISAASATRVAASEVEADYTTSHVFVDEVSKDKVPFTIFFDPQVLNVESAEVFTNLNRRDRAIKDADGDGIEDGISPPPGNSVPLGSDKHYYKAYSMPAVNGGYQIVLQAEKCGAYRLTVRYRLKGDQAGIYRWYGDEVNSQGIKKRDHAIVVSPMKARNVSIYEINPLTILATGTAAPQRSTFADLANGLPPEESPRFSLTYAKNLGCNMLWMQPIHPRGISGRIVDPTTNKPFALGSPYSVKNYFEIMPLMAKNFVPTGDPNKDDTPAGRAMGMKDFQAFVRAADEIGMGIMLDAPFNHTAHDVELAACGQKYWGNPKSTPNAAIGDIEARVFSRNGLYGMRARSTLDIALAPDRSDFGKWNDVIDLYYGRYAALVTDQTQPNNYQNEGDWFEYSLGDENASGPGNGHFDAITQNVWRYFGDYLQFWLTQTGYPANANGDSLDSDAGIDGLRMDFAQGLPPQCCEYLINRTRARKWNFVFLAESLDGGKITYRSGRHFDVLNDNLIYDLHGAMSFTDYSNTYKKRRDSYGAALILLNTSSQDEDNYSNPFDAFVRYAVNSTMEGVPMIFPGQELGLIGTIVPPGGSTPKAGKPYGYERYEFGFGDTPKPIPLFKDFNSMMPLWRDLAAGNNNAKLLQNLYSGVGRARVSSPSLRSSNRVYLKTIDDTALPDIFRVAKFEKRNASPSDQNVVFCFVNLKYSAETATPAGKGFNVNVDEDGDGVNDFGIRPDRFYNVKNLAAYTGVDDKRRDQWLWNKPRKGDDLLKSGIDISLNQVPADAGGWKQKPYEPLFLKLFEVAPE